MIRLHFLLALILIAAQPLSAQAPESISDQFLVSHFNYRTGSTARLTHLRADGTYRVLTSEIASFVQSPPTLENVWTAENAAGTFTYVREAENQGRLAWNDGTGTRYYFDSPSVAHLVVESLNFYPTERGNPRQNVSLRSRVAPGSPAIGGFILGNDQWVLLRVIGPGLREFGLTNVINEPVLSLYRGQSKLLERRGWDLAGAAPMQSTFSLVGAFPLAEQSKDCALLVWLGAGTYTVHANDANNGAGEALIEVYYLPIIM